MTLLHVVQLDIVALVAAITPRVELGMQVKEWLDPSEQHPDLSVTISNVKELEHDNMFFSTLPLTLSRTKKNLGQLFLLRFSIIFT